MQNTVNDVLMATALNGSCDVEHFIARVQRFDHESLNQIQNLLQPTVPCDVLAITTDMYTQTHVTHTNMCMCRVCTYDHTVVGVLTTVRPTHIAAPSHQQGHSLRCTSMLPWHQMWCLPGHAAHSPVCRGHHMSPLEVQDTWRRVTTLRM